jgi:RNA-binding protein YhbY
MKDKYNKLVQQKQQKIATIQIGKKGFSDDILSEIQTQLKRNDLVKIKILKNSPFETRSQAMKELRLKITGIGKMIEVRGWTAIIANENSVINKK